MNRIAIILGIMLLSALMTFSLAQNTYTLRPSYLNLSYVHQNLKFAGADKVNSSFGAAFTIGHTYYICKNKPIANMIRFGLDATWLDLNYANYNFKDPMQEEKEKIHQLEIGMQVGPSVTITPVKNLNISAYFRFAPSFAALFMQEDKKVGRSYASFFVTGASVTYKIIGLGIEKRWGKCTYKGVNLEDGEDEETAYSLLPFSSAVKTNGLRIYLSFRF